MKRLLITAIAIAGLTLTACSSSATTATTGPTAKSSSSATGLEKTHLVVAVPRIIQAAPLFLAIKEGYFSQEGLTVTPEFVSASTAAVPDMIRGSVDIAIAANYVSFFELQASGATSIRVVAPSANCNTGSNAILALPSSGITGPASLAGKTVAVQINPNIQTLSLNALLPSRVKVRYVQISFPSMIAALEAHRVDAISEVEPFITEARVKYGAHVVMSWCTGAVAGLPQAGDIATAAWVSKYPNTAAAFAQAIERAQALAESDPSAVVKILPTYIPGLTASVAARVDLGIFPPTLDTSSLQHVADLMKTAGMLKSPLAVSSLIFRSS